jgi:hypothetical protein
MYILIPMRLGGTSILSVYALSKSLVRQNSVERTFDIHDTSGINIC